MLGEHGPMALVVRSGYGMTLLQPEKQKHTP